jgi:hypothetical protein
LHKPWQTAYAAHVSISALHQMFHTAICYFTQNAGEIGGTGNIYYILAVVRLAAPSGNMLFTSPACRSRQSLDVSNLMFDNSRQEATDLRSGQPLTKTGKERAEAQSKPGNQGLFITFRVPDERKRTAVIMKREVPVHAQKRIKDGYWLSEPYFI